VDGGAAHFAESIRRIREKSPSIYLECLTGDFAGNRTSVELVADAGLHVYAHNIETVEQLTGQVRDRRANYRQSLAVLRWAKERNPHLLTKSSIMLGLGEKDHEVRDALTDLRAAGVDCVTFGQYMRPTKKHMPVTEYVHPDKFKEWQQEAEIKFRFLYAPSGPLVRSSYRAGEFYLASVLKARQQSRVS
jgi:lipoyl synthase